MEHSAHDSSSCCVPRSHGVFPFNQLARHFGEAGLDDTRDNAYHVSGCKKVEDIRFCKGKCCQKYVGPRFTGVLREYSVVKKA